MNEWSFLPTGWVWILNTDCDKSVWSGKEDTGYFWNIFEIYIYICDFSNALHIAFPMHAYFLGKTLNVQGMRILDFVLVSVILVLI